MGAGVCLAASPGTDLAVQGQKARPAGTRTPHAVWVRHANVRRRGTAITTTEHQQPSKLRKKVLEEEVCRRRGERKVEGR